MPMPASTVLALKFVYYLDGKRTLESMPDDLIVYQLIRKLGSIDISR